MMPLMPVGPIFRRQGRIINGLGRKTRKRRMRGGNLLSDVGRSAMNIFTSNNKKATALNELKNLNSTLRTNKYISNYLKNRQGVLGKIGSVASLAGYGRKRRKRRITGGRRRTYRPRRTYRRKTYRRRTLRGGSFFGKVFGGIKKGFNVLTKPIDWATSKLAAPVISYGVRKLIGGRYRRRTYRPRRTYRRKTYRKQRGGFFLTSLLGGPIKTMISAAAKPVIGKLKNTAINYAKSEGSKLLDQLSNKIQGAGRRRYRRKRY